MSRFFANCCKPPPYAPTRINYSSLVSNGRPDFPLASLNLILEIDKLQSTAEASGCDQSLIRSIQEKQQATELVLLINKFNTAPTTENAKNYINTTPLIKNL